MDLEGLGRDIDADLRHDLYRQGVESPRVCAGRVRLKYIAFQPACPGLSHLAATGIAGAEEEHSQLVPSVRSRCWMHKTSGSISKMCLRRWASFSSCLSVPSACRAQRMASLAAWGGSSSAR